MSNRFGSTATNRAVITYINDLAEQLVKKDGSTDLEGDLNINNHSLKKTDELEFTDQKSTEVITPAEGHHRLFVSDTGTLSLKNSAGSVTGYPSQSSAELTTAMIGTLTATTSNLTTTNAGSIIISNTTSGLTFGTTTNTKTIFSAPAQNTSDKTVSCPVVSSSCDFLVTKPSTAQAIATALEVKGVTTISDATDSNSATTGALKIVGGLGVAKNIYAGGSITSAGALGVVGTSTFGSYIKLPMASKSVVFREWAGEPTSITGIGSSGTNLIFMAHIAYSPYFSFNLSHQFGNTEIVHIANGYLSIGRTNFPTSYGSNQINLVCPDPLNSSYNVNLPSATGTLALKTDITTNPDITSFTNATDASAIGTASVKMTGGLSVAKNMYLGENLKMATGKQVIFPDVSAKCMVLFNGAMPNDHQFVGIGAPSNALNFQVFNTANEFTFKHGTATDASATRCVISSDGLKIYNTNSTNYAKLVAPASTTTLTLPSATGTLATTADVKATSEFSSAVSFTNTTLTSAVSISGGCTIAKTLYLNGDGMAGATSSQLILGNGSADGAVKIQAWSQAADRTAVIPAMTSDDTFALLGRTQTFTGTNKFNDTVTIDTSAKGLKIKNTNNYTTLLAGTLAGDNTLTLPTSTGTLALTTDLAQHRPYMSYKSATVAFTTILEGTMYSPIKTVTYNFENYFTPFGISGSNLYSTKQPAGFYKVTYSIMGEQMSSDGIGLSACFYYNTVWVPSSITYTNISVATSDHLNASRTFIIEVTDAGHELELQLESHGNLVSPAVNFYATVYVTMERL